MCMGLPFSCPGHVEALLKSMQDLQILEAWEGGRSCLFPEKSVFLLGHICAYFLFTRHLCFNRGQHGHYAQVYGHYRLIDAEKCFTKSQTHYESMCYLHLFSRTALLRLLLTSFCMWSMSISMVNENYQIIRNASNLFRQLHLSARGDLFIQHFTNLYF